MGVLIAFVIFLVELSLFALVAYVVIRYAIVHAFRQLRWEGVRPGPGSMIEPNKYQTFKGFEG
jgi:hypothetical protein